MQPKEIPGQDRLRQEFIRQSQPLHRSSAKKRSEQENNELGASKSVPAINRKKETIGNFKNKLDRLEKNKQDLENKMKLFDQKVKAHTMTRSLSDTLGRE